jgi:hypothetical protein
VAIYRIIRADYNEAPQGNGLHMPEDTSEGQEARAR